MLLAQRRQVLLRELQRVVHAALPDELDQPLLLQVERELLLLLQNLHRRNARLNIFVRYEDADRAGHWARCFSEQMGKTKVRDEGWDNDYGWCGFSGEAVNADNRKAAASDKRTCESAATNSEACLPAGSPNMSMRAATDMQLELEISCQL